MKQRKEEIQLLPSEETTRRAKKDDANKSMIPEIYNDDKPSAKPMKDQTWRI